MKFDAELGAVVKRARESAGLTQAEFAAAINTTQSAVSLYECGNRSIRLDTIDRMAAALDRPLTALLGVTGDTEHHIISKDSKLGRLVRFVESKPEVAQQLYAYGRFLQAEAAFTIVPEDTAPLNGS